MRGGRVSPFEADGAVRVRLRMWHARISPFFPFSIVYALLSLPRLLGILVATRKGNSFPDSHTLLACSLLLKEIAPAF